MQQIDSVQYLFRSEDHERFFSVVIAISYISAILAESWKENLIEYRFICINLEGLNMLSLTSLLNLQIWTVFCSLICWLCEIVRRYSSIIWTLWNVDVALHFRPSVSSFISLWLSCHPEQSKALNVKHAWKVQLFDFNKVGHKSDLRCHYPSSL